MVFSLAICMLGDYLHVFFVFFYRVYDQRMGWECAHVEPQTWNAGCRFEMAVTYYCSLALAGPAPSGAHARGRRARVAPSRSRARGPGIGKAWLRVALSLAAIQPSRFLVLGGSM